MTWLGPIRPLRDITLAALVCLLAGACGDKDGETTGGTDDASTGSAGSTGAATTGPPVHECLDSCGSVLDCSLDDPSTCPEGQVCVDHSACGCEMLFCETPQ